MVSVCYWGECETFESFLCHKPKVVNWILTTVNYSCLECRRSHPLLLKCCDRGCKSNDVTPSCEGFVRSKLKIVATKITGVVVAMSCAAFYSVVMGNWSAIVSSTWVPETLVVNALYVKLGLFPLVSKEIIFGLCQTQNPNFDFMSFKAFHFDHQISSKKISLSYSCIVFTFKRLVIFFPQGNWNTL